MNITHTFQPTRARVRRIGLVAGVLTATLLGADAHVSAAPTPLTIVAMGGTAQPSGDGTLPTVEVVAPNSTRPIVASGAFMLRSYDDTFPDPGLCEPATAEITITGDRKSTMTLAATGTVCGDWPADEGGPTIQKFVGRYLVTDGPARYAGDDGFANIVTDGSWAYVFAIDT